jgi:RNA polymerase sigma-70 factor, ECF subfamily
MRCFIGLASAVIALKRAAAVAIAQGRAAGFRLLNELEANRDPRGHFLLPDSRADLLRRPGDWTAAP